MDFMVKKLMVVVLIIIFSGCAARQAGKIQKLPDALKFMNGTFITWDSVKDKDNNWNYCLSEYNFKSNKMQYISLEPGYINPIKMNGDRKILCLNQRENDTIFLFDGTNYSVLYKNLEEIYNCVYWKGHIIINTYHCAIEEIKDKDVEKAPYLANQFKIVNLETGKEKWLNTGLLAPTTDEFSISQDYMYFTVLTPSIREYGDIILYPYIGYKYRKWKKSIYRIKLTDTSFSNPEFIIDGSGPSVSNDGIKLLFSENQENRLRLLDLDTRKLTKYNLTEIDYSYWLGESDFIICRRHYVPWNVGLYESYIVNVKTGTSYKFLDYGLKGFWSDF